MKDIFKIWLCAITICLALSSCGKEEDEPSGLRGNVKGISAKICGEWYCIFQEWSEDGDASQSEYEPTSAYSMRFDSDGHGYMRSGDDSLFEIMFTHAFKWKIESIDGYMYLLTDVYDGERYKILSLSDNYMELLWEDEDYSILCKFIRHK